MCGRYSLTTPVEALRQLFGFAERPNLPPRANIAPTQEVPAVRLGQEDSGATPARPERHLALLRWGLIPAWAKDPAIGNRMINARAEGLAEKPAFRAAFRRRRCLVPADGFYEWRKEGERKQPYRIVLDQGRPFAFAGLWERWAGAQGAIESFTIVTTEANDLLRPVHDRMPVILDGADYAAWLDPATPTELALALLTPYGGRDMAFYKVSPRINSPANDDPSLIEPIEPPGA